MSILKILMGVGGLFGLFYGLAWLSNDLTGCYKYTGDDGGIKIPKPNSGDTCGCSNALTDINTLSCLNKICGVKSAKCDKVPTQTKDWSKWPWCANVVSSEYPTCGSGVPGENHVVYYAYRKYTPAGIMAKLPTDLINASKGFGDMVSGLLKQMIKWIILVFILLLLSFITYLFGKYIFSKSVNKNSDLKFF